MCKGTHGVSCEEQRVIGQRISFLELKYRASTILSQEQQFQSVMTGSTGISKNYFVGQQMFCIQCVVIYTDGGKQ